MNRFTFFFVGETKKKKKIVGALMDVVVIFVLRSGPAFSKAVVCSYRYFVLFTLGSYKEGGFVWVFAIGFKKRGVFSLKDRTQTDRLGYLTNGGG